MGFFDDVADFVTKPVRDFAKAAAKTIAGSFDDITEPFLKPLDRLLDVLSPRFRLDGSFTGRLGASISGGTTHRIVFPQIPGLSAGTGVALSDVTGGLLSDLAFNSEELRRSETELDFLASAMRRGVYPHRDDVFVLGWSVTPKENLAGEIWIRVRVSGEEDRTLAESTLRLRASEVQAQVANLKPKLALTADGKYDSEEMAAALERSYRVQLNTEPGLRSEIRVKLTAHAANGTENKALHAQFQELAVWVERSNAGYSDVLHFFECREPEMPLNLVFPLDRIAYISEGEGHQMDAVGREGGAMAAAAGEIDEARKLLATSLQPPPEDLPGSDRLAELLGRRVARAEGVREKLWQARKKLVRLQTEQGTFDYRLRYKLRMENQSATARRVTELQFKNESPGQNKVASIWELTDIELPKYSRYEITVYPLQKHGDNESEATVRMADANQHVSFSLLGGLGLSHRVLRSVLLKSQNGQPDTGELRWKVADRAQP